MDMLCILWYCIVLHVIALYCIHGIAWYCIISYGIALLHCCIHGIAWYCIVGFSARAVSRKTPIYFIIYTGLMLKSYKWMDGYGWNGYGNLCSTSSNSAKVFLSLPNSSMGFSHWRSSLSQKYKTDYFTERALP